MLLVLEEAEGGGGSGHQKKRASEGHSLAGGGRPQGLVRILKKESKQGAHLPEGATTGLIRWKESKQK